MSKDYKRFADILKSLSPEESLKGKQDWLSHLTSTSKVGKPWRAEIKKDPELVKHIRRGEKIKHRNPEKTKEYHDKYRKENFEKIKEYQAKYRKVNFEKEKARISKYYKDNLEKIKDYKTRYRKENLERINEYQAKYRKENPEKFKARDAKAYRKKSLSDLINFKKDETRLTPEGDVYAVKGTKHYDETISQKDLAKKRRTNLFLKSLTSKFKRTGGGSSTGVRGGGLYLPRFNPRIKKD